MPNLNVINIVNKMFNKIAKKLKRQAYNLSINRNVHKSKYLLGTSTYDGEGKTTLNILNNEADIGLMIDGFSQVGFRLNNGFTVLGPMVIFPKSVLSWNINDLEDINDKSLSLFKILEPKLDILVVGVGDKAKDFNFVHKLLPFSTEFKIAFEVMPTEQACSTFNFLNSEGRNVAGALIPPKTIITSDDDELNTKVRYANLYGPD